jgi:hypothetical protein
MGIGPKANTTRPKFDTPAGKKAFSVENSCDGPCKHGKLITPRSPRSHTAVSVHRTKPFESREKLHRQTCIALPHGTVAELVSGNPSSTIHAIGSMISVELKN